MRIYLSHNFEARFWLREKVREEVFKGHEIVSSWIYLAGANDSALGAIQDLEDLNKAEVVVVFLEQLEEKAGKGKYWEWGAAYALKKFVILVQGEMESGCIFWRLHNQHIVKGIGGVGVILNRIQRVVHGEGG